MTSATAHNADHHEDDHTKRWGTAAVVLLAVGALTEAARVVMGETWGDMARWGSAAVSISLVVLWVATACAIAMRRRSAQMIQMAWIGGVFSTIAMLAHGLGTRVVGGWWGLAFVPAAAVLAIALSYALAGAREERLRERVEASSQAPETVESSH